MIRLAWRNLQRNKSRTWLTAGGIGFSVLLVSFAMSMQSGSYEIMIDSATRYFSGHGQVSDASYFDQPRFERTVLNAAALQAELETIDGLSVMPRVQAFAVVSMGEKSLGGMVMEYRAGSISTPIAASILSVIAFSATQHPEKRDIAQP